MVWALDVFLHSIGPCLVNGVGAVQMKKGLFGSKSLVGSMGKKKGVVLL